MNKNNKSQLIYDLLSKFKIGAHIIEDGIITNTNYESNYVISIVNDIKKTTYLIRSVNPHRLNYFTNIKYIKAFFNTNILR